MKKIVAILLLACMMVGLVACGASEAEYKLGMGVSVSTDSSSTGKAQIDATAATVVLDSAGKIVLCRIDCAQNKMDVTGGAVDTAKTFLTKRELREDYNMVKFSNATLEWYQQAENFETYCVGKTADEIANIETKVNEEGYNVAVDETLYAGCSISIEDFIGAVVKACNDEKGQTFKASGVGTIAGAYVMDGKFQRGCSCRITRDSEQIFDGALVSVRRFKDDVKEVATGYECGLVFEKFNDIKEDDMVEAYTMVEVPR